MYFTSNMSYIGGFSLFSLQKVVFGATWLRVFGEISVYLPTKVPTKSYIIVVFHYICVFALANYVFCGISPLPPFQNVKFHATCNVHRLCSIINVFCFKEPPFVCCGVL